MHQNSAIDSMGSLLDNFRKTDSKNRPSYDIISLSGDNAILNLLPEDSGPYLIKIDVEGFEDKVISGLKETFKKFQPQILVEVLPHNNNADRMKNQANLQALLAEVNYSILAINTTKGTLYKVDSFTDDKDNLVFDNYILVANENKSSIFELAH